MGEKLKGVHVWWTKPAMKDKVDYYMPDHQLITLMLSALYWKKNYGEIVLYTDEVMVDFLKKTGIYDLNLWDEINTEVIENIPNIVNPNIYWAGAKLFVERQLEPPFVMIDTDAYAKDHYKFDYNMDVMYFHLEDMIYPHYPPPNLFIDKLPSLEMTPPKFVTNVAVLFFNNKNLLDEYTYHGIEFMIHPEHNIEKSFDSFSVRMVFIEQVILSMILQNHERKYKNVPIINDIFLTMYKTEERFYESNYLKSNIDSILQKFDHVWGKKQAVEYLAENYKHFMSKEIEKLSKFKEAYNKFLEAREVIKEIDSIENYKKKFSI